MPRPPLRPGPRTTALENAAFLHALRQTGNAGLAARAIGRSRATMERRRGRMPGFATEWTAALVVAGARLHAKVAQRRPETPTDAPLGAHRTKGGEPVITRTRGGRLQQQTAPRGRLTRRCEQAFLLALSSTANVRLSAAAAGSTPETFYRRRERDEAFAREWRLALAEGYARLELRCLAAADPESHEHDAWRHNAPPEPPPMTIDQMLQLLHLHQKEARLLAEPPHLKRRRGESREAHSHRLSEMHEASRRREREKFRVAEALRAARGQETHFEWEQIALPDLAQVEAALDAASRARRDAAPPGPAGGGAKPSDDAEFSSASDGRVHGPGAVLFGGWRIKGLPRPKK